MTLQKKNLSLGLLIFLLVALVFYVFRYKQLVTDFNSLALKYNTLNDSISGQQQVKLQEEKVKLEKGQLFTTVVGITTDGKTLQVPNKDAKAKMIVFSSSTCPNCDTFHPVLSDFANTRDDVDIVVLQYDATPEEQQKILKDKGYNFSLMGTKSSVLDSLNVMYTPTTVILDKANRVDTVLLASQDLKTLHTVFDKLHL